MDLPARLIRLYAWPGARVLDPFAGSGTVGLAAQGLGCYADLIDVDAGYCELAARRLKTALDPQNQAVPAFQIDSLTSK